MPAGRNQFDPDRRGGGGGDARARMARTLARLDVAMEARRREREALMRRLDAARGAREAALAAGRHALERRLAAARGVLGERFRAAAATVRLAGRRAQAAAAGRHAGAGWTAASRFPLRRGPSRCRSSAAPKPHSTERAGAAVHTLLLFGLLERL
jgi:hypothetical protein